MNNALKRKSVIPQIDYSASDRRWRLTYRLDGHGPTRFSGCVLAASPEAAVERIKRHLPAKDIIVKELDTDKSK